MLTCSVSLAAMPSSSPVPYCKEKASPPCSYESDRKDLNFWCTPAQNRRYLCPEGRSWTHSPVQNWPRCRRIRFGFFIRKPSIEAPVPSQTNRIPCSGGYLFILAFKWKQEIQTKLDFLAAFSSSPPFIFTPLTCGAEGGRAAAAQEQAGGARAAFGAAPDPSLPNS